MNPMDGYGAFNGMGIGGSMIPMPPSRQGRMISMASQLNQAAAPRRQFSGPGISMRDPMGGFRTPASGPTMLNQNIINGSLRGGVNPGQGPEMNAVQAARMQGQGGPPPGMAGRDPNDPRNAALAGYRPNGGP